MHATGNAQHHASGPLKAATLRIRERILWAVGTALAAGVLMFCYLRIAGATQMNSDGAGIAIQASSMLHGNLLLHGWWSTDVSFYTTELPEYMLVETFAGLRPEVTHICAALTYTLLVLLAAYVARGRARGAAGVIRALIAAGVILAPQPSGPTVVLLGGPDHVGTAVPVLVLLLLLEWAPPRWYVPVGACLLLAWSIVGDPLVEVIGVLPLGLAALLWAWRARPARRGNGAESGPRAGWYLSLAVAAAAAVPLAAAADSWLIRDLGGFTVAKSWFSVVTWPVFVRGLPWAWQSVLTLFGADYAGVTGGANVAFAFAHLGGVAIVAAGLAAGAWRLIRPPRAATAASSVASAASTAGRAGSHVARATGDLVAGVLVLAIVANFAAFLVTIKIGSNFAAHEIGPVLSLGAALAGRMLGEPLLRAGLAWPRWRGRPGRDGPRPGRRPLVLALAAGLAAYAFMLGVAAASTQAAPEDVGLAAWLARHHLYSGLSPYWEASTVTVDSAGKITMLSVVPLGWHGHLVPQQWLTDVALGDPTGHAANFMVLSPIEKISSKSVLATFGRPAMIYHYAGDTIMVWHKNLIRHLGPLHRPDTKRTEF